MEGEEKVISAIDRKVKYWTEQKESLDEHKGIDTVDQTIIAIDFAIELLEEIKSEFNDDESPRAFGEQGPTSGDATKGTPPKNKGCSKCGALVAGGFGGLRCINGHRQ